MRSALLIALAIVCAPLAQAQETSARIFGQVTDSQGTGIGSATITVTHVPTGTRSVVTTRDDGSFTVDKVRVGGPYRVEATRDGYDASVTEDVTTQLGRPTSLLIEMKPSASAEVLVAAAREKDLALGVGSEFTIADITAMPSVSRDLKDIVRIDPKILIDPTNQDAIEIAGTNSRYNSITVDGIRQSDDFGLNNNGYPSTRAPISLDAIQAVTVEIAPFDVQYSGFQGGNVNIITKSGTNDFHGSAFYYYTSNDVAGNRSKDIPVNLDFEDQTWGATIGGPILTDRLWFFLSYEEVDAVAAVDAGPNGAGFPVNVTQVSLADYDQILDITENVYGYFPGELVRSNDEKDERFLAKIDWAINDAHRLSLAYQKNDGSTVVQPNASASLGRIGAQSNWYTRPISLEQLSLQVFSNWTPWLSTEFKAGRKEVDAPQTPVFGANFSEFQIRTSNGGTMYVGPDQFRHANVLTNDLNQFKLLADMYFGDHTVTAGVEYEQLEIYNLFVPNSLGQYIFPSIASYQNRVATSFVYNNAFTNDASDGAARFTSDVFSLYLQDSWRITPELTLQAGLRYEQYLSSDEPPLNTNFLARYGLPNTETFDGRDLLLPRFGFDWQALPRTQVRGGVGLFGGGSPNVWLSNSFSVDGVVVVQQNCPVNAMNPTVCSAPAGTPIPSVEVLTNVDGSQIPQPILAAQGGLRNDGAVNAIAPDFEIPSSWRYNLGLVQFFDLGPLGEDFRLGFDVLYTDVKDQILYQDIRLTQVGTAPDGRPIYAQQGPATRGNVQDLLLLNTSEGESWIWTIDLRRAWTSGNNRWDFFLGYSHQDVEDVNPGTSSQASSNWDNLATADPNDPPLATSNYEIENRVTLQLSWARPFFGDYDTGIGVFLERRSGRPFSYTFGSTTNVFGDPRQAARQRQLFYVPANATDVEYAGGLTPEALESFITASGLDRYRGQIAPRNAFASPWVTTLDVRFSQEIPAFIQGARAVLTLDIENLANLMDSDYGQLAQVSFPYVSPVLNATINPVTNRYVYSPLPGRTTPAPALYAVSPPQPSVWRMQFGIRFEF
jgi:hypothetical protein